ncbi:MAG TPA: hypothetical protein VFP84_06935, partial [Kofleriaceae bacterium]|nr:hypothetical protein [Kofleriaceae bacterium]
AGVYVTLAGGGGRDAVIVWPTKPGAGLTYKAPKGAGVSHIVLDAPASDGKASVTAKPDGDACAVTVAAGGRLAAAPLIVTLDAACAIAADPEETRGAGGERKPIPARRKADVRRGGCCETGGAAGGPMVLGVIAMLIVMRRRRAPATT